MRRKTIFTYSLLEVDVLSIVVSHEAVNELRVQYTVITDTVALSAAIGGGTGLPFRGDNNDEWNYLHNLWWR